MLHLAKRARRDQRLPQPQPILLTERDKAIIRAISTYRLLRQDQLARLFFSSRSAAQRVLQRLYQHGYVTRRFLSVRTGRSPTLYALDQRGAALLQKEDDLDCLPRYVRTEIKTEFLAHLLAINDVRVAVTLAAKQAGYALVRWLDQSELRADYDRVFIQGAGGRSQSMPLIPDSYFTLQTPRGYANCFLEMDMGTMTTRRFQGKVDAYMHYYRSGGFERRYGAQAMRVLTVTSSVKRLANLKAATEAAGGKRPFWFAVADDLSPETMLNELVWQVATETPRASLIEPV